ncbi:hypothetical protein Bhyg_04361 [Pseudolycoriella hygida]|uniref:Uncharacterized protein n=1 Tax=Pseudolycoriella hygida TaxID=35572 RepID=A0A9Q0NF69_9DIPT|nr:hypothetical protein Bhyg_04361 [Pseudolycoriella hygida]
MDNERQPRPYVYSPSIGET